VFIGGQDLEKAGENHSKRFKEINRQMELEQRKK
jgi:Spy/CpxP family protein refolding chaperone